MMNEKILLYIKSTKRYRLERCPQVYLLRKAPGGAVPIKHNDDEGTPLDWYHLLAGKHVLWVLIIVAGITCFSSAIDVESVPSHASFRQFPGPRLENQRTISGAR